MKDFFLAGGYGMVAVTVFGFLLVAASVLHALRPAAGYHRVAVSLGVATFMTGLLGAVSGICLSMHYIHQVPPPRQLGILSLGIDESLHNVVLALIFVVLASLAFTVGAVRQGRAAAA